MIEALEAVYREQPQVLGAPTLRAVGEGGERYAYGASGGGRHVHAGPLETVADPRRLLGGRRDERQPVAADLEAEHAQRSLDRDRVRRHLEQLLDRRQLAVDPPARPSSPSLNARTSSFTCGPTMCVWTQMPPTPPRRRNGKIRLSSPA